MLRGLNFIMRIELKCKTFYHAHSRHCFLNLFNKPALGNSIYRAVGVIAKLRRADASVEQASALELSCVVEKIGLSLEIGDSCVIGESSALLGHKHSAVDPRAGGRGGCGVGKMLAVLALAERGVDHIIEVVPLVEPRAFGVGGAGHVSALGEGLYCHRDFDYPDSLVIGNHVLVEKDVSQLGVAEVEVCLTVVIDKYGWVDIVPVALVDKRVTYVGEWACGAFGHSHGDSHAAVFLMNRAVEIEFSVAMDALGRPCSVLRPGDILFEGEYSAVILPVDHILGGEAVPVEHGVEVVYQGVFIVRGVQIQGVAVNHRSGVGGVDRGYYGVGTGAFCIAHGDNVPFNISD